MILEISIQRSMCFSRFLDFFKDNMLYKYNHVNKNLCSLITVAEILALIVVSVCIVMYHKIHTGPSSLTSYLPIKVAYCPVHIMVQSIMPSFILMHPDTKLQAPHYVFIFILTSPEFTRGPKGSPPFSKSLSFMALN